MSGAEVIPFDQGREPAPALPHNIEAEAVLLGGLMQANDAIGRIADKVLPEHFFEPLHARIFSAIVREHSLGNHADPVTLQPYFVDDPSMVELGRGYLAQLTGSGAAVVAINGCAEQVVELAHRRKLLGALTNAADLVTKWDESIPELIAEVDAAMNDALRIKRAEKGSIFAEAFDRTLQAIEDEAAGLGPQGIKVQGLEDFNGLTGDLRRGELWYVGGRPSMGKTALSLRLALGAAEAGNGTLFISLEMREPELVTRAIADLAFDYGQSPGFDAIRRGRLDHFTRERIAEARQRIAKFPLVITDPPSLNISRLAMMIRRYRRRLEAQGKTLDLVIVDYLGLIKGSDRRAKRYEEVGEISRTLKEVAKECDVAMVVLAQLNRECERRDDKRPMLSDLRDAGDIEQDADGVLFVYRDEYYLERSEPEPTDKKRAEWEISMGYARDRMEIIAAKVRNGRVGKRNLYFFAKHQAVRDSTFMRDAH
jgi:replicative DNA helicase